MKHFLNEFQERLILSRWQEWDFHVKNSERFAIYRTFCTVHDRKSYLKMNLDKHLKFIMTRFRCGISEIAVHHFRYKKHSRVDLICPLCKNGIEDEVHFVFCCPILINLRKQYIPVKYYRYPCQFRFSLLLSSRNENIVRNLSIYTYKALKLRSIMT